MKMYPSHLHFGARSIERNVLVPRRRLLGTGQTKFQHDLPALAGEAVALVAADDAGTGLPPISLDKTSRAAIMPPQAERASPRQPHVRATRQHAIFRQTQRAIRYRAAG